MSTQSVGAHFARAVLLVAVAGCAAQPAPTGYEPRPDRYGLYGYSDQRVGDDEYTVVVHGNALTSRERVAQIALLRAAHLTIAQGRSHFLVVKRMSESMSVPYSESALIIIGGATLPVPVREAQTYEPDAVLLIQLLPAGAARGPEAVDAAEVVKSLEPEFRSR